MEKTDLCYACKKDKPVDELICIFLEHTHLNGEVETKMVFVCKDCAESKEVLYA